MELLTLEEYELNLILMERDLHQLQDDVRERSKRVRQLQKDLVWLKKQLKKARTLERIIARGN